VNGVKSEPVVLVEKRLVGCSSKTVDFGSDSVEVWCSMCLLFFWTSLCNALRVRQAGVCRALLRNRIIQYIWSGDGV